MQSYDEQPQIQQEGRARFTGTLSQILALGQDLSLLLASTVIVLLLAPLNEPVWVVQPVRLLFSLVVLFFVPGYCLTAALFPRKRDLDISERIGLSIGLSVALMPVVALIVDRLPWGFSQWPVLIGVLSVTVLLSLIVLVQRVRLPADEVYAPAPTFRPRLWWQRLHPLERRIYAGMAAILLPILLALGIILLTPTSDNFMTEFYMLNAEGQAEQFPRTAVVGEDMEITMGIVNREREAKTYRVEIRVTYAWNPDEWNTLVAEAGPFTLEPGEEVEQPITWQMPWSAEDVQIHFQLFTDEQATPYRSLLLWLDVTGDDGGESPQDDIPQ